MSNSKRTRTLVLLVSGLIDCILGGVFLLAWLGILPMQWIDFSIPRNIIGGIGWVLALSGTIMVVYQAARLMDSNE